MTSPETPIAADDIPNLIHVDELPDGSLTVRIDVDLPEADVHAGDNVATIREIGDKWVMFWKWNGFEGEDDLCPSEGNAAHSARAAFVIEVQEVLVERRRTASRKEPS
jgi:hypothetical protein